MSNKNICKHKNDCPIYNGKTISDAKKVTIYKNVFCNRGFRGWKNCKQYLVYENQGYASNENDN